MIFKHKNNYFSFKDGIFRSWAWGPNCGTWFRCNDEESARLYTAYSNKDDITIVDELPKTLQDYNS